MIAFDNLSVTFGQLISYAFGAALTDAAHGWRIMVAIGGIPPIILACLLPKCPESPRQLIAHGKVEEARKVIAQVYSSATEEQLKSKMDRLVWTVEVESQVVADKSLWWQFKQLHCVPSNLRALIVACAVMASTLHHTPANPQTLDTNSMNSLPARWFQYSHVLLCYPLWPCRLQQAYRGRRRRRRYQLLLQFR